MSSATLFRVDVLRHWKKNGRHKLPWRKTKDPYKILVSEIMLQQTQVPRVLEKYKEFLKAFPNVRALSKAPLSNVMKVWSGMGYNRRAKFLRDAAKKVVVNFDGRIPADYKSLRTLPGVGDYTARAIRVFAFNEPDILIETNTRAALIHHFFMGKTQIRDREVWAIAERVAKSQDPRMWHAALMDYGVYTKKLHDNPSRRSAHHAVQSKFEGSSRQVRGAILRLLQDGPHGDLALMQQLQLEGKKIREALVGLKKDGLITSRRGSWQIA